MYQGSLIKVVNLCNLWKYQQKIYTKTKRLQNGNKFMLI